MTSILLVIEKIPKWFFLKTLRHKIFIVTAFLAAIVAALYLFSGPSKTTPSVNVASRSGPANVEIETAKSGQVTVIQEAVGTVRAAESILVTAKVSGIISDILFVEGQKVASGDILVKLDNAERQADILQTNADIRKALADRDEIRQKLNRAQSLRKTGAGTEAQVDDLAAQLRSAEGGIASSQARLQAAQARLDDLVVRAPFEGRVGTRSVSLGAYVSPGLRITTLDSLAKVRLDFSVPENLLSQLKVGQNVAAKAPAYANREFSGQVTLIDPRVDVTTRTVRLTADFINADEALKPGMFLSVLLSVATRDNAVLAREEAIVGEGLRQFVFVVKDNKAERRLIRIGQRSKGYAEILDGLKEGEPVIIKGLQRIQPGANVKVAAGKTG